MEPGYEFVRRLRAVSDKDALHMRENFVDAALSLDPANLGDHTFFPLEMTWFYGEPVWHEATSEQRLMLNRLTFSQSYLSTAVAEAATNVLNYEAALRGLVHEDVDVALYMAREVVEETTHIEAFLIVIRKVLSHYGMSLDELRAANPSLALAARFSMAHQVLGWMRRSFDYYYFTRFALNVNQKTVERCTIDEPDLHPVVRGILRNHAIDEARHMQMSRASGRAALARMRSGLARRAACVAYAHFAANIAIGRHSGDTRLQRETRVRTLEACGVRRADAEAAYEGWISRRHQPVDPPLVHAGRRYYVKQNYAYIDDLDVTPRMRHAMKRTIARRYADVASETRDGVPVLDFQELERA